jgi:hypothetical protein
MSAPVSQVQWYLARDGQQYGPLSEPELAKFIELGHLQPTDLLWRDGFPDWRPAMVVFPPQRQAPRPAPGPRPAPSPQRQAYQQPSRQQATPRAAAERGPAHQHQDPRPAAMKAQQGHQERYAEEEEDELEPRGRGLRRVMVTLVVLALLGAAGWFAFPHRATLIPILKTLPGRVMALVPDMGKGQDAVALTGLTGSPEEIDKRLQGTKLWRLIKRVFPDWYAERLKEAAALAAQDKGDAAVGQHLARSVMKLRREQVSQALAAGYPQLKAVATTFYENLVQLRKQSIDACFAFISQGEASPVIVSLMQSPQHAAPLQAQLTAVFEAIADGRKTARVYPQPRKSDYDTLAGDLAKRGWTQADMQLFSDERALSRAPPEKVCQLVTDWFAAQLDIKDQDIQLRLLVDSLKPVVAG